MSDRASTSKLTLDSDLLKTWLSEQPHLAEDLTESVGVLLGYLLLHRRLRKFGYSPGQRFVLASVLIGLAEMRSTLRGIRKELRESNKSSPSV